MENKKIIEAIQDLERVYNTMNDCVNKFIIKNVIDNLKEQIK